MRGSAVDALDAESGAPALARSSDVASIRSSSHVAGGGATRIGQRQPRDRQRDRGVANAIAPRERRGTSKRSCGWHSLGALGSGCWCPIAVGSTVSGLPGCSASLPATPSCDVDRKHGADGALLRIAGAQQRDRALRFALCESHHASHSIGPHPPQRAPSRRRRSGRRARDLRG